MYPERSKKKDKKLQDIIIEIELDRRRGKKYPEFDFKKCVEKQKSKHGNVSDDDDMMIDMDAADVLKRIEKKYVESGKKKKLCIDDFVDKTRGYDLNDPFVDDGDIYDELLPSTMDTTSHGFYVNSGKLEFKNAHGDDDDDEEEKAGEKKEKPPVPSSSRPHGTQRVVDAAARREAPRPPTGPTRMVGRPPVLNS
uniref:HUN domain-containing protein n=1 Tax=Panagrellus redivivus TaxID=6233 RepID=A0A7E4V8B8_PANRE